jgi:hypothetical protein
MIINIGFSLVALIVFNMSTGVIPKLINVMIKFVKDSRYKYKTGQCKCKPKRLMAKKEKMKSKT